jgi:hypothetical protein
MHPGPLPPSQQRRALGRHGKNPRPTSQRKAAAQPRSGAHSDRGVSETTDATRAQPPGEPKSSPGSNLHISLGYSSERRPSVRATGREVINSPVGPCAADSLEISFGVHYFSSHLSHSSHNGCTKKGSGVGGVRAIQPIRRLVIPVLGVCTQPHERLVTWRAAFWSPQAAAAEVLSAQTWRARCCALASAHLVLTPDVPLSVLSVPSCSNLLPNIHDVPDAPVENHCHRTFVGLKLRGWRQSPVPKAPT